MSRDPCLDKLVAVASASWFKNSQAVLDLFDFYQHKCLGLNYDHDCSFIIHGYSLNRSRTHVYGLDQI